jgi:hypothetical protein
MGTLQLKGKWWQVSDHQESLTKINTNPRTQVYEELVERRSNSQVFQSPRWEHWKNMCSQPREGRLPDRQRHVMLDLIQRREFERGHGPCQGGSVGCHLAEVQWPPLERYNPLGMVLTNDGRQGDPDSSEAGQHRPVILERLLLLRLQGRQSSSSALTQWSSR